MAGRIPALVGAEDARLLLGFADEEDPFVALERGEVLVGDIIFALALLEFHEIEALRLGESLDRLDELLRHRRNQHRRRHPSPQVGFDEVGEAGAGLERGDVSVEVHPINRFQFEGDVIGEDRRDTFAYHRLGAPGERGPCGHRPQEGLLLRRRAQSLPCPRDSFFLTRPCLRPCFRDQPTTCSTV